jgi:hypothetical protein
LEKLTFRKDNVVHAARDIFGKENIRVFGEGAPDVFFGHMPTNKKSS